MGMEWEIFTDYPAVPNGRIWVCWKHQKIRVRVLYSDSQLVHCIVEDRDSYFKCTMTFVCGLNTEVERKALWHQLRSLNTSINDPWVILGDFNTMLSVGDRINAAPVHPTELIDFQDCVEDIGVGQLTRRGCHYSWCNKRDAGDLTALYHIPECSDHSPILVNTEVSRQNLKRSFRLYNVLLQNQQFKQIAETTWQQHIPGYAMYRVWQKLKLIAQRARPMSRAMNGLDTKLEELRRQVEHIQNQLSTDLYNTQLINEEKEVIVQLEKWSNIHEKVVRQKSRATWITYGNSNTKFFHASLKARQARNKVAAISNDQGETFTAAAQTQSEFLSFFTNLLGTRQAELPSINVDIARDGPCLTHEHGRELVQEVTREEILVALKDLPLD
ncbi:uncharacterized protein LOC132619470 [Lycium barbarum]|uniref:uncharacterized protein LOC132619470 n=1 Tax=Lycium barbarum TaxID=112863 RepID=UPI00293E6C36|nr:uncharacterized protein LOC132619470 [Lycium barbarum]